MLDARFGAHPVDVDAAAAGAFVVVVVRPTAVVVVVATVVGSTVVGATVVGAVTEVDLGTVLAASRPPDPQPATAIVRVAAAAHARCSLRATSGAT